jgi:tetratricopeptide (TPR) repeat protein
MFENNFALPFLILAYILGLNLGLFRPCWIPQPLGGSLMANPRWIVHLSAILFTFPFPSSISAQSPPKSEPRDYSKEPYVIERVLNKVKFENDGTYAVETEIRVRVQSAAGVQNWGLIQLPYASSYGDAVIDNVKVTKADGSVVTTPPENTQDVPAQITVAAPFYSDLKEKELAVKGLESGDVLEYHDQLHVRSPLIPGQFWFDFNFFQQGIILQNELQISVPHGRFVQLKSPKVQPSETDENGYHVYSWKTENLETKSDSDKAEKDKTARKMASAVPFADVELTSFRSWDEIAQWYRQLQNPRVVVTPEIRAKAEELTRNGMSENEKIQALYGYVSTKFRYIGVAFGIGRYQPHAAAEVLSNGYGDCKDKHTLLAALLAAEGVKAYPALINSGRKVDQDIPSPSHFDHMITVVSQGANFLWLDTTPEVAPFGLLTANLRDNQALIIPDNGPAQILKTPADPPFPSMISFHFTGKISDDGVMDARAEAEVRGDLEVTLRAAFRQTPQPQWKDIVQAIARAWTFAGTVSDVTISSPEATESAFSLKYAYARKDYADWPDVFRPPLPPVGLAQLSDDADKGSEPNQLESPGEYIMDAKVELPADLTPRIHPPVDIKKDFAEYHATYSIESNVLHSERHLIIHMREVPRTRSDEYKAFSKAVSDDSETVISLARSTPATSPEKTNPNAGASSTDAKAEDLVRLGDGLFNQNDLDGAIAEYGKALQLQPDNFQTHRTLGNALFNKNSFDEAAAEYREAIRLKPDDPDAHRSLGDALYNKGDYDGALAGYHDALRLKTGDGDAHRGLGDVFFVKGDLDQAATEYREAVRLMPNDSYAHRGLASTLFRKGDVDGAIAEYREVQRLEPDDLQASYGLGSAYLRRELADQAINEFKKSVAAAPNDPNAYQMLASAYAFLHRCDEALDAWKQVEKLSPGGTDAPGGIAMILVAQKRYAEAIAELQPVVESNPRIAPLAFSLGVAYARSGNGDKAIAAFQKALEVTTNANMLNGVGYELAEDNVRLDDALRFTEQAVEQGEDSTATIDLSSLTLADLRKMTSLAAYWDSLGWAHFRLGHMEEAQKFLAASWKLAQIPAVGDHLGQLYEKMGDKRKAINYYALTLATNHAPQETSARLENLIGSKVRADGAAKSALDILGQQRTVKLQRVAKGGATAEFFVEFRPNSATGVKFINGSEELQGATKALASATYDVAFPDQRAVRLVRRGILDCPATGPSCQFVLFSTETVNSIN